LIGAQTLGDVLAITDLVILCPKRDLAFSPELAAELEMQSCLVGLASQEEVGTVLLVLPKNERRVWKRVSLNQYALKVEFT